MIEHVLHARRSLPGAQRGPDGGYLLGWLGTAVMGIINVTPDSFSDGGDYLDLEQAVQRGLELASQGALVLDVGGESTRPGSQPVPLDVEIERVVPVIERLVRQCSAVISVDTSKPEVAAEALSAGAHMVNDVTGLRDPDMVRLCARAGVPAVVMHMRGEPGTMQDTPSYQDVRAEVHDFLLEASERALAKGVPDVLLDPGIGFGKNLEHNLSLLRSLAELSSHGKVLVGASRKGMIRALAGDCPARQRDPGSLAVHLFAASAGAAMVRVHDVAGHVQALRVWERLSA